MIKMNKLANASIILIGVVVLALVLKTLQLFLRPLALAIILTLLLLPLMRFSKEKKIPFFIIIIGLFLILIVAVGFLGSLIGNEIAKIDKKPSNKGVIQIQDFVSKISFGDRQVLLKYIEPEKIGQITISIIKSLIQAVRSIFSELFIALLFLVFLVPSHETIIENIGKTMRKSKTAKFKSIISQTEKSVRDYVYAKSVISLGTAIASAIVLLVFKADFILIFAILFFILNFIPNIGSIIAVVLALLAFLLTHGLSLNILWLGVLLILIQILFGNLLEPKFAGGKLKLSPIIIILSLFLWFWIWGIVGMILAIPITSIIKIVLEHIESTNKFAKLMS